MNKQATAILKMFFLVVLAANLSCTSTDDTEQKMNSLIAYPFINRETKLGKEDNADHFIIRSATGNTEYTVEIPSGAQDYDIEIPIAEIKGSQASDSKGSDKMRPQVTDRELTAALPKLPTGKEDAGLIDNAFGVGEIGGPSQPPSYTMGLARVNKLYIERKFEYALMEINNLLSFFPNSSKLRKMKGTVLIKIRNYELAEKEWIRALELSPYDATLRKALQRLQKRMETEKKTAFTEAQKTGVIPKTVGNVHERMPEKTPLQ